MSWLRLALATAALASASTALAGHGNPFSHLSDWGAWVQAAATTPGAGTIDGGDGVATAQASSTASFTSAQASSDARMRRMTTTARGDLAPSPPASGVAHADSSYYDTYEITSSTLAPGTAVSFDVTWSHSGSYGATIPGDSGSVVAQSDFEVRIWSGGCSASGCGAVQSPAWLGEDFDFSTGLGTTFDHAGSVPMTTLRVGDHFGIKADLHDVQALANGLLGYSVASQATVGFSTGPDFSIVQWSPPPPVPALPAGWGPAVLALLLAGAGLVFGRRRA
jgi:hypothetical protein